MFATFYIVSIICLLLILIPMLLTYESFIPMRKTDYILLIILSFCPMVNFLFLIAISLAIFIVDDFGKIRDNKFARWFNEKIIKK